MDFNQVNYDGDLDDLGEEELRSTVEDFEKAQETNVAEFNATKEQLTETLGDDVEFEDIIGEVQDFTDAKTDLVAEVTEFESFEDAPVTEADLNAASFNRVREYHVYFAELDAAPDADEAGDGDDGGSEFGDMGSRGETHTDEDDDAAFARKHLRGMPGFGAEN